MLNPKSIPRKILLDRNYQIHDQIRDYIKDTKNLNKINSTYNNVFENPQMLFREIEIQAGIKQRKIDKEYQNFKRNQSSCLDIGQKESLQHQVVMKKSFLYSVCDQQYHERQIQRQNQLFHQKPIQIGFRPTINPKIRSLSRQFFQ
ncbi:hypothetical protein SS50377_21972 [Spironucleus salmonicida]|uniref:Uncharacterized protein n=1 Tax=Spironucleus salmonicida TaxID=348837 RepID=A0A9P8LXV1_9EUKA|nr:hypothetical protein SS50377_21972 [Spironucleus salmonicida]